MAGGDGRGCRIRGRSGPAGAYRIDGPAHRNQQGVSSGAFFGVAGRLIGSVLEATASVAFAALSVWTGGDALAGALTRFFGLSDTEPVQLVAYGVLATVVTIVSVLGHSSMVLCQKFMIPTAGTCLVIRLFVYGRDFDPGDAGTGSYALGSVHAAWLFLRGGILQAVRRVEEPSAGRNRRRFSRYG